MIQANYNKPRSATQEELEDLFLYETQQKNGGSFPDFVEDAVEYGIQHALIAVWDTEDPSCKQMVVYWSWKGITAWYQWKAGVFELVKFHTPPIRN